MTAKFTTRDGRLWVAAFTDATEQAALDELGIRLSDLARRSRNVLIERFKKNLDQLGGLLWLAVHDQVTERGVTVDDFARAFSHLHFPGATAALLRAIAVRYPHSRLYATLD